MTRQRFRRPTVRKASKRPQWTADYFVYVQVDGAEHRVHKVARFGLWGRVTKAAAQEACDRFMGTVNSSAAFADASMTPEHWWQQVFKPVRGTCWGRNTRIAFEYTWRRHIEPNVGGVCLSDFNKLTIDRLLLKLAEARLSEQIVKRVLVVLHAMFEEAVDNDVLG
jgi:hypothetical protein